MGRGLLIIVTGVVLTSGIVTTGMVERMQELPERNSDYYYEQQARNISTGLIDRAIEQLKINNDWTGGMTEDTLTRGKGSAVLKTYTQNSSGFPTNMSVGSWDEYKVLLYSEASYDGYKVSTEVLMQKDSFSKYSYYSDSELSTSGGNIYFFDKDTLSGPIHTNGTYKMSGSPTFNGLVTSPNMWQAHSSNPTNPIFNGGTNFNAPTKQTPSSYELNRLNTAATNGGLRYERQLEIDLYAHTVGGVVKQYADIRQTNSSGTAWESWQTHDISATNGVISTSGRIDLKNSTIVGTVTIHSETLIEIDGDVRYNTDPRVDSTSTDILGLVSEGSVRVDAAAHSSEGSVDVDIHGTIMALNNSFYVESYTSGGNRGDLNMLGGIVQKNRGAVGTFSGSSIVSGFTKNYEYDERLRHNVPPVFPRESVFSILYWKDKVMEKTTYTDCSGRSRLNRNGTATNCGEGEGDGQGN